MSHVDPYWPRALAWIEGECFDSPIGQIAICDVPLNISISPGECHLAPDAIRSAMHRLSTFDVESGTDVRQLKCRIEPPVHVSHVPPSGPFEGIAAKASNLQLEADAVVYLGGDNGITRPLVNGLDRPLKKVGLVTFDQHYDLRTLEGGPINGNPVRGLLEDGLPGTNITQIGIGGFANSAEYDQVAKEAGINVITMNQIHQRGIDEAVNSALKSMPAEVEVIHFDLDVDVLDRAFAPACPGSRPGGMNPAQAIRGAYLMGLDERVVSMDLVEIDPTADEGDRTCLAAGMMLLAFAAGLTKRLGGGQ